MTLLFLTLLCNIPAPIFILIFISLFFFSWKFKDGLLFKTVFESLAIYFLVILSTSLLNLNLYELGSDSIFSLVSLNCSLKWFNFSLVIVFSKVTYGLVVFVLLKFTLSLFLSPVRLMFLILELFKNDVLSLLISC